MGDKLDYKRSSKAYNQGTSEEKSSDSFFDIQIKKQPEDENDKWLDTDEAARYLSITPNALRILVHRARVVTYKLGRRLRFKKTDLNSLLHKKED